MRVLKMGAGPRSRRVGARETAIGMLPHMADLNLDGMSVPSVQIGSCRDQAGRMEGRDPGHPVVLRPFGLHIPYEIRNLSESLSKAMQA